MQTYLFYDLETTGLSKAFDQILQFAAIRTDSELNELERLELKIRLNPDVIVAPKALITHEIPLSAMADGVLEYEAIKQIHQWLNLPGTVSLGYNTLGFDDEFLRFSFYRNLLPPYHHQFKNRCSRMDIYPITALYYLFKKDLLKWPEVNDKLSLKLADLKQINLLCDGPSHHAMTDVETTLALARRFFKEREMWDYVISHFNKEIDQERLGSLKSTIALMIDPKLAHDQYQSLVWYLGHHDYYKNQQLWLCLDKHHFAELTAETVVKSVRVIQKKNGEPYFILPLKERFLANLTPERMQLAEANLTWLQNHPAFFAMITEHYANYRYPDFPEADIDARLYLNGFWTFDEENLCRTFHHASIAEKVKMAETSQNPKIQPLMVRLLGKNYPEALTPWLKQQFAEYMAKTVKENGVIDYQGNPRLTPGKALAIIQELQNEGVLNSNQTALLQELGKRLSESRP